MYVDMLTFYGMFNVIIEEFLSIIQVSFYCHYNVSTIDRECTYNRPFSGNMIVNADSQRIGNKHVSV